MERRQALPDAEPAWHKVLFSHDLQVRRSRGILLLRQGGLLTTIHGMQDGERSSYMFLQGARKHVCHIVDQILERPATRQLLCFLDFERSVWSLP